MKGTERESERENRFSMQKIIIKKRSWRFNDAKFSKVLYTCKTGAANLRIR